MMNHMPISSILNGWAKIESSNSQTHKQTTWLTKSIFFEVIDSQILSVKEGEKIGSNQKKALLIIMIKPTLP